MIMSVVKKADAAKSAGKAGKGAKGAKGAEAVRKCYQTNAFIKSCC